MDKLAELQAERKTNYDQDLEVEMSIAKANDVNGLPYQAPPGAAKMALFFQPLKSSP